MIKANIVSSCSDHSFVCTIDFWMDFHLNLHRSGDIEGNIFAINVQSSLFFKKKIFVYLKKKDEVYEFLGVPLVNQ